MTSTDRTMEAAMTLGGWTEATASERIANLRREAKHQRLVQLAGSGRDGSAARRGGWVHWRTWGPRPRCAHPVATALTVAQTGVPPPARRPVVSGTSWPARYEVRVDTVLDDRWSHWFEGLRIEHQGGQTLLSGTLPDQPALHGILDRVRDLGLSIIAVRRLPPDQTKGAPR